MLHFNCCPKCLEGTVYEHDGLDGPEKKCVNCGYTVYEVNLEVISLETPGYPAVNIAAV